MVFELKLLFHFLFWSASVNRNSRKKTSCIVCRIFPSLYILSRQFRRLVLIGIQILPWFSSVFLLLQYVTQNLLSLNTQMVRNWSFLSANRISTLGFSTTFNSISLGRGGLKDSKSRFSTRLDILASAEWSITPPSKLATRCVLDTSRLRPNYQKARNIKGLKQKQKTNKEANCPHWRAFIAAGASSGPTLK